MIKSEADLSYLLLIWTQRTSENVFTDRYTFPFLGAGVCCSTRECKLDTTRNFLDPFQHDQHETR